MGIVAMLVAVLTMFGAVEHSDAVYPSISLVLLPAAYAILIQGVLSISTHLPRPLEHQSALNALGCLLFIALILWIAYDLGGVYK